MSNNTIDPNTIDPTTRAQWCQAQLNTCGTLCNGDANDDTCDADSLAYDCTCASNNSSPGLRYYTGTLPTFICEAIYANCLEAGVGDATAQELCKQNEQSNCGHLDPLSFVAAAPSSTTSSTISSASSNASGTSASHSTSSTKPPQSTSSTTSRNPTSEFSATSSPSSTRSFTTSPSTTTSSTPTASSDANSSLSTGAKVGIGVGVAFGVVLLCVLVWLGLLMRRLLRRRTETSVNEIQQPNMPEMEGGGKKWPWSKAAELKGSGSLGRRNKAPAELSGEQRQNIHELDNQAPRFLER